MEVGNVAAGVNQEGIVRSEHPCAINPLPRSGFGVPGIFQMGFSHGCHLGTVLELPPEVLLSPRIYAALALANGCVHLQDSA